MLAGYPETGIPDTAPAIAEGRLSLTGRGHVRYTLKTPYRDGTSHVVFELLDFIARLAALVPRPLSSSTCGPMV